MENEAAQPLFVSDPVFNKEGVTGFTSYTLQGSKIPEPLSRRYRDFDALRRKFIDRWPGVFIPNIPHKKTVGNKDKEIVGLRIEMINRFLKKLSKIDYLFNSDEMELFLQNSNNVPKTLDSIKEDTYEELLKKYASVFTDYDDNFDTITGKRDQDEFAKKLNENYPKLRAFRAFIAIEKERFKDVQKNYLVIINNLSIYEKEVVNTFVNNDENKLVFYNMKNIDLCKNISNAQEKVINPYDRLYEAITEDYLDTEAMQEALESLKKLQDEYNKLTKNLTSTNITLNDLQAGKSNIKSMFSFKGREESISGLMMEKEKLEKDIENLGQVIKIATFNMQNQIKNFKNVSLEHYYGELSRIEKDTESNAKIFDDLWETVVKDGNISEYN
jgi:transposase-like protein